jgi:hypothetical protein
MPPCEINVDKFKAKVAPYDVVVYNDILKIKQPPLACPGVTYINDTTSNFNNLRSKLFQFAYRYVYQDFTKSTYSPWSKVPLPTGSTDPATDKVVTNNNAINVQIATGSDLVTHIEVIARIGVGSNDEWGNPFLALNLDLSTITNTGTYTFTFHNNGSYAAVSQPQVDLLFSNVPLIAGTQGILQGNAYIYGDITEGYNYDDVSLDVTMGQSSKYYTPEGDTNPVSLTNADVNVSFQCPYGSSEPGDHIGVTASYVTSGSNIIGTATVNVQLHFRRHEFAGTTPEDRSLIFTLTKENPTQTIDIDVHHEVVESTIRIDSYSVVGFRENPIQNFVSMAAWDWLAQYGFGLVYFDAWGRTNTVYTNNSMAVDTSGFRYDPLYKRYNIPTITGSINHKPPIWARYYQWVRTKNLSEDFFLYWTAMGIKKDADFLYFDISNLGHYGTVNNPSTNLSYDFVPGDRLKVFTNGSVFNSGFQDYELQVVGLVIDPKVGNANFITGATILNPGGGYTSAPTVTFSGGGGGTGAAGEAILENGQVVAIKMTNMGTGYTQPPNITFSGGGGTDAAANAILGYYEGTFVKCNIIDYDFEDDDSVIKIYRPSHNVSSEDTLYYEFGECYPILNPGTDDRYHAGMLQDQTQYVPATFIFSDGDVFFTGLNIPIDITVQPNIMETYFFMTKNYDDNFKSAQDSNGRSESIFVTAKQQNYPTLVRFSQKYVSDTMVNETNIFFDEDQDEYDRSYGAIRRFTMRQNFMRVFQELRVGNVPVGQSVIQTANGQQVVGQSDSTINNIQYYAQIYGIGDAVWSLASENYADYFIDTNRGVWCRVSLDGVMPISVLYGTNTFWNPRLPYYNKAFLDATTANPSTPNATVPTIYGVFDTSKNEYIIASEAVDRWRSGTQVINQDAVTMGFNEDKNGFEGFYSYQPEGMACLNNLLCSFKGGLLYTHNSDVYCSFYGTQYDCYITLVFNDNLPVDKCYLALREVSNTVWWSDSVETSLGQLSKLPLSIFKRLEGKASTSFRRDINSAGGQGNGHTLKGSYIKIRLRVTNAKDLADLSVCTVNYNVYP